LSRVFFASSRQFLVSLVSVELGDDVVDGLVNVELFAAEDVDESCVSVWESVNADVALCDNDEPADSPFGGIVAGAVDESVGGSDLVHPDNVGKLIEEIVDVRKVGELSTVTLRQIKRKMWSKHFWKIF